MTSIVVVTRSRHRLLFVVGSALMFVLVAFGLWWTFGKRPPPWSGLRVAVAPRTTAPMVIDGKLDELGWNQAPLLGPFVMSHGRSHAPLSCTARVLWDDSALYVAFEVDDEDILSPFRGRDEELWTRDVVEVFLDPDGDGKWYYEFQTNVHGALFDARFPSHRKALKRSMQWNAEGLEAGVIVRGIADDGKPDQGWTAELKIPLSAIDKVPRPPRVGDVWRMNLFRIDVHAKGGHYTAWTPPLKGDFHTLDRFGYLVFGP